MHTVAAVRAVSEEAPSKLVAVLLNQSLTDTLNFVQANAAALTAAGVQTDAAVGKARLLALAALCLDHLAQDLAYVDAAAALQVPVDEVERWIIDGARKRPAASRIVMGVANGRAPESRPPFFSPLPRSCPLWARGRADGPAQEDGIRVVRARRVRACPAQRAWTCG